MISTDSFERELNIESLLKRFKLEFADSKTEISSIGWPIVAVALLIILSGLLMVTCYQKCHPAFRRAVTFVKDKIVYNSILRYLVQSFLRTAMVAMFGIKSQLALEDFRNGKTIYTSSAMLTVLICFTLFSLTFMWKNSDKLIEPMFMKKFGALYEPARGNCIHTRNYPFFYCYRRLLLSLIIVFVTDDFRL